MGRQTTLLKLIACAQIPILNNIANALNAFMRKHVSIPLLTWFNVPHLKC